MPRWRRMQPSDLEAVEALGSGFHINHPESAAVAPERLELAPDWCFVLDDDAGRFCGYCISHPWAGRLPPGLNVLLGSLPGSPERLHIHDVVLAEDTRGRGHAGTLVTLLETIARDAAIPAMSLIAVDDALKYWGRQGFERDRDPASIAFVARSYGGDATPMVRALPAIEVA